MRVTIKGMLVAVAMLAVACAGMKYRTPFWMSIVLALSLLLYATMTVRAVALYGRDRAFATAFAIVGTSYSLLAASTLGSLQEYLITNYPIAWAAKVIDIDVAGSSFPGNGFFSVASDTNSPTFFGSGASSQLTFEADSGLGGGAYSESLDDLMREAMARDFSSELRRFFLIGHSVWSWLFGLLAGWFASMLVLRDCRANACAG